MIRFIKIGSKCKDLKIILAAHPLNGRNPTSGFRLKQTVYLANLWREILLPIDCECNHMQLLQCNCWCKWNRKQL